MLPTQGKWPGIICISPQRSIRPCFYKREIPLSIHMTCFLFILWYNGVGANILTAFSNWLGRETLHSSINTPCHHLTFLAPKLSFPLFPSPIDKFPLFTWISRLDEGRLLQRLFWLPEGPPSRLPVEAWPWRCYLGCWQTWQWLAQLSLQGESHSAFGWPSRPRFFGQNGWSPHLWKGLWIKGCVWLFSNKLLKCPLEWKNEPGCPKQLEPLDKPGTL